MRKCTGNNTQEWGADVRLLACCLFKTLAENARYS